MSSLFRFQNWIENKQTMQKLSKKQKQLAIRRHELASLIGSFRELGCWWSMKMMLPHLKCTEKQLRADINHLLKVGTITEKKVYKGKKIVRTLFYDVYNNNVYPQVKKTKVYTLEPKTPFDMTCEELNNFQSNGYTAEQYYGKYKIKYEII